MFQLWSTELFRQYIHEYQGSTVYCEIYRELPKSAEVKSLIHTRVIEGRYVIMGSFPVEMIVK
jgi:hypothetical protein